MKIIYKYELPQINTHATFQLKEGAQIIHSGVDPQFGSSPCFWALIDTDKFYERRVISVVGTGIPLIDSVFPLGRHISTFNHMDMVYHVFEGEQI